MKISRREALKQSTIAVGAAVVGINALACESDDTTKTDTGGGGGTEAGTPKPDSGGTPGPDTGGPTPDSGGGASKCTKDPTNTIGRNHGHSLTVTKADVDAGKDKTYDIMGTSPHPHKVTVTAANFAELKKDGKLASALTSTNDASHDHPVNIVCA